MLPYWIFYGVYALSALNGSQPRGQNARPLIPMLVAAIATILFIGLRYRVGGDWNNYLDIFNYTADDLGAAIRQGDPGYMALNWLAREMGFGIGFVNFVCAIVFTWGLFQFVRHEPNPWLSILVAVPYFIIVVSMGYTRQGVAIAMIMASLVYFLQAKYLKMLVYIGIAALFHKTAIAMLPLIMVSVMRYRVVVWTGLGIVGLFLFQLLLGSAMDRLTTSYVQGGLDSGGATVRVLMNVMPALIFLRFSRHFSRSEEERRLWRNFSLAAIAAGVGLYLLPSTTLVDRLALYLTPLQVVVLGRVPYAAAIKGRPNVQLLVAVLAYSAAVQFVWLNFATYSEKWVPYQSFIL